MSMFYCEFHDCTEDSDVVGFNETDFGHRCDEGAAALEPFDSEPFDGFLTDAEADADVLSNAGWGTDEDYGYFGDE